LQEHTQAAMAIAERHANERDDALASAAAARGALETLRAREENERSGLAASVAALREAETAARHMLYEAATELAGTIYMYIYIDIYI